MSASCPVCGWRPNLARYRVPPIPSVSADNVPHYMAVVPCAECGTAIVVAEVLGWRPYALALERQAANRDANGG